MLGPTLPLSPRKKSLLLFPVPNHAQIHAQIQSTRPSSAGLVGDPQCYFLSQLGLGTRLAFLFFLVASFFLSFILQFLPYFSYSLFFMAKNLTDKEQKKEGLRRRLPFLGTAFSFLLQIVVKGRIKLPLEIIRKIIQYNYSSECKFVLLIS